jgi:hypothetical protein
VSPDDLDELASRMLWPATRLVAGVHDSDALACHDVLAGLGLVETRALCVVLAALVPDDAALVGLARLARGTAPVSDRQAAKHRAELEAELKRGRAA